MRKQIQQKHVKVILKKYSGDKDEFEFCSVTSHRKIPGGAFTSVLINNKGICIEYSFAAKKMIDSIDCSKITSQNSKAIRNPEGSFDRLEMISY